MKNEFFGDERDLLKYDFLLELISALPTLKQVTNVPMLTAARGRHGNLTRYAKGPFRQDVYDFLTKCLNEGKRDIGQLSELFKGRAFTYSPYEISSLFGVDRSEYFERIPTPSLKDAVVFFDPDTGLEPPDGASAAHLRFEEIGGVLARSENSVAALIQFFPHTERTKQLREWTARLRSSAPDFRMLTVRKGDVGFLVLAPSQLLRQLAAFLSTYSRDRGMKCWPAFADFQFSTPHFGYGSNMNLAWLKKDAPSAREIGSAALADFEIGFDKPSALDGTGKANIRRGTTMVEGVLFEIDHMDLVDLNAKEGGYEPLSVEVKRRSGMVGAWTYIAASEVESPPAHWYLLLMICAARAHHFDATYVRWLVRHSRTRETRSDGYRAARTALATSRKVT